MTDNKPTIDGIILINIFNESMMKLEQRSNIDTTEKMISELYRIFPMIVKKAELKTEIKNL